MRWSAVEQRWSIVLSLKAPRGRRLEAFINLTNLLETRVCIQLQWKFQNYCETFMFEEGVNTRDNVVIGFVRVLDNFPGRLRYFRNFEEISRRVAIDMTQFRFWMTSDLRCVSEWFGHVPRLLPIHFLLRRKVVRVESASIECNGVFTSFTENRCFHCF